MKAPDQYGVVGHPINHSWSPFIHGLFAKQTEQSLVYRLYDIAPVDFRGQVLEFFARGGRGLNVTVPHKEAAAELANELTTRADRAGAVNTLMLNEGHDLLGDNTDGHGLVTDLRKNLALTITNERILILGAGGATRDLHLRTRLDATAKQLGEGGFADYLAKRVAELKGVALYDVEREADGRAWVTVEYVFAEEKELQRLHLEEVRGRWVIADAEASRREKSLIPYGTPIEQVE